MAKLTIFFRRRWARSFDIVIVQNEDVGQSLTEETEDTVISKKKRAKWQRTRFLPATGSLFSNQQYVVPPPIAIESCSFDASCANSTGTPAILLVRDDNIISNESIGNTPSRLA